MTKRCSVVMCLCLAACYRAELPVDRPRHRPPPLTEENLGPENKSPSSRWVLNWTGGLYPNCVPCRGVPDGPLTGNGDLGLVIGVLALPCLISYHFRALFTISVVFACLLSFPLRRQLCIL